MPLLDVMVGIKPTQGSQITFDRKQNSGLITLFTLLSSQYWHSRTGGPGCRQQLAETALHSAHYGVVSLSCDQAAERETLPRGRGGTARQTGAVHRRRSG